MTNAILCEHDWVDGACAATAPEGTPGWELRTGPKGDTFWMCPQSAAEFPEHASPPAVSAGATV